MARPLGRAAQRAHHAEGHDEGEQPQPRDQQAGEPAAKRGGGNAAQRGEQGRHALLQQQGDDHGAEGDDRADRQVDAAGDDDERHAERRDADDGGLLKDDGEIVPRNEGVEAQRRK
ncbi:MAG: hypothetical protein WDM96_18000 [Lacunisphaera sp.]